ncbi:MAG TPA: sugar ABC transporter substrate-binding protein [Pseudolysinimonas sp.]|nr:sugar ABC transporter substrate-binding protein [Pseudolysinimonas sp.]
MSSSKHFKVVAVLAASAIFTLAGCSAGGGGTTSGGDVDISKAQQVIKEASAEDTSFTFPKDSVEAAKGLSVVAIPCAYAAEGCKRTVDGIQDASKELGWNYKMIDPAGDPEKMREGIRTAIQLKVDAIFLAAVPPEVAKDDVAAAQAAGITVINTLEVAPEGFADATVESDRVLQGKWAAAFLTVATKGEGKIVLLNDPEFSSIVAEHKGVTEGLKEYCPKCKVVKDSSFQIANLQTEMPTEFQATLTANPDVNAVWGAYDPVAAAILPVIDRSDRSDSITVVSHNGDAFALKDIKADKKAFKATLGFSDEWIAFAAVDQLLRIKAGTITDEERRVIVPSKLLTADNITDIPWLGDSDWRSAYLELWGK